MLAVATTAAVVVGGTAAYSTNANSSESNTVDAKQSSPPLKLVSSVHQIPHPEKQHKGGEDTFLISSNGAVLGVFDGVGGWADSGVDPREYAVKLSEGAQEATDLKRLEDPVEVMRYAAAHARRTVGSSTACIVTMKENKLVGANLGDSGFLLIRPGPDGGKDVQYFKTKEQQYSFNFPYQLGSQSSNSADDADRVEIPLQHGDIVVLGTDGLFDNLDEKIICQLVVASLAQFSKESELSQKHIDALANIIAQKAFKTSQDPKAATPFAIASNYRWRGGKPDDITVLVSRVTHKDTTLSTSQSTSKQATTTNASATVHSEAGSSTIPFKRIRQQDSSSSPTPMTASETANFDSNEDLEEGMESPSFLQRLLNFRPWTSSPAKL